MMAVLHASYGIEEAYDAVLRRGLIPYPLREDCLSSSHCCCPRRLCAGTGSCIECVDVTRKIVYNPTT
jgi:hypothetical protein